MIVLKFGGTSLATPENIRKVVAISARARQQSGAVAVVCSAFGGVTNQLILLSKLASERVPSMNEELEALCQRHRDAVHELIDDPWRDEATERVEKLLSDLQDVLQGVFLLREASKRSIDFIMSFGERLCALITSYAMRREIPDTAFLDSRNVIVTDDQFGLAQVRWDQTRDQIRNYFNTHPELQVTTGFIAATEDKRTTTLGRGGSDYTASLFGAALECSEIQIWTDVSGVLTADPRKVDDVRTVPALTYEEAMEVAHFGAKVIYPPTMAPAMKAGVPLRIKNTFDPDAPGTIIGEKGRQGGPACAITSISSVALLQLKGAGLIGVAGIAGRLFNALASADISVILISQASSEHSICFAVKPEQAEQARRVVSEAFEFEIRKGVVDKVTLEQELSIIAMVGEAMREHPGIVGRMFAALGSRGINVEAIAQGSSELNISFVVKRSEETRALRLLHEAFFTPHATTRLFLVGYGLIGKTLLNQLEALFAHRQDCPPIKLCGLVNSRKMLLDNKGIELARRDEMFAACGQATDTSELMRVMKEHPNCVLVDCTAGKAIPALYVDALTHGIAVVTPNKIANTGDLGTFKRLQRLARSPHVKFYYEANVGAGLPVIGTLKDLVDGGDEIIRIEAVLSGTLSYLFNTFGEGDSFTDLLSGARDKGYTEPDPRDDLSGTDVARKLLILARESGLDLELGDIAVENLVPESCRAAEDVATFFDQLRSEDGRFTARLAEARAEGKALRYVATLENGQGHVSLRAVPPSHPCYDLSGSDNLVSFTTSRYSDRPMVIKGPGAGAEVTAAQCLAEILRIANP